MNSFELIQVINSTRQDIAIYVNALPAWVQYWMLFMRYVFLLGFIFALWHKEARVISVALIYSMITTYLILLLTGPTLLWGLAHILYWLPALVYVGISYKSIKWKSIYGAWLGLASVTMFISLVFDIRDVFLYFVV